MKKRSKHRDDDLNFWQPASDMFSAMLLVLMLVILMLGLYLVYNPEENQEDGGREKGENTVTPVPTAFFWFPDGVVGSWETPHPGTTPSATPTPTVSPTPDLPGDADGGRGGREGSGKGRDPGLKSAVYVTLTDAETERTVKEEAVEFELYGERNALQVLNVYYPERISYRAYKTTEDGTFYLPEKLPLGTYELHALTEPEGYVADGSVGFTLGETCDWSDPFVVEVPVYPAKGVIQVQMNDAETGQGVGGGSFAVTAEENIITADGTLRYRAGQQVGEIVCGENGFGVSGELYLGSYRLVQKDIPPYYAGMEGDLQVRVEKQSKTPPLPNEIACRRTRIRLKLADELNPARGIPGAVFTVTGGKAGLREEMTTNGLGEITMDQLEKGVTYHISQTGASGDYRPDPSDFTVTVNTDGRFGGETETSIEVFNHVIRVAIGITDEFSSVQVSNVNLALYDGTSGALVRSWTSSGVPLTFTNLSEGPYYLYIEDDTGRRYDFYVHDKAELQEINLNTSRSGHNLIYGGIILLALILAAAAVTVVLRMRKKRRETQGKA